MLIETKILIEEWWRGIIKFDHIVRYAIIRLLL